MMTSREELEMRELLLNILNTEEDCVYLGCFTPLSRNVMFDTYNIEVEMAGIEPIFLQCGSSNCVLLLGQLENAILLIHFFKSVGYLCDPVLKLYCVILFYKLKNIHM